VTEPSLPAGGWRRFTPDAVAAALLVLLDIVLYRKVLRLFWTYDDPNILRTLFDFRLIDTFTNGRVWPQQLFTPLMMAAFRGQLALFGMDHLPGWYAVHLGFAALTTLAVYAAVRPFLRPMPALSAAATFTAGVPFCSVVTQLSTVHYFIAIFFCALATIAYVVARRRSSVTAAMLSAGFYLLAMLAKEVAVPLPLLLLALPVKGTDGTNGTDGTDGTDGSTSPIRPIFYPAHWRWLIPHGVAGIIYFAWRYAVLGTFLGAYGWKIDAPEWPRLLVLLPWRIVQGAAGTGMILGLTLVALMLLAIAAGVRGRRNILLLLVAAIVVLGPMLPLAKEVNRRYVLVPWLALSIGCAAAATGRTRRQAAVLLAVVPLLTLAANRQEWRDEFALRLRLSDEARFFFFDIPPNGLLRSPAISTSTLSELNWLKTIHLGQPPGPSWFFDDIFLCSGGGEGRRVWEYQPGLRMMVETTPRMAGVARKHCSSIRPGAPLTATFHYRKPALYWDLGPYSEGRYTAILGNGYQVSELPRRDALNLPGLDAVTLRIRYQSPQGWSTYSPDIPLDFVRKPDVTWRR
jgi:hypothetical protein